LCQLEAAAAERQKDALRLENMQLKDEVNKLLQKLVALENAKGEKQVTMCSLNYLYLNSNLLLYRLPPIFHCICNCALDDFYYKFASLIKEKV
jgi:hypothetical protein